MINATIKLNKRTLLVFVLILAIIFLFFLEFSVNSKEKSEISLNSYEERIAYINSLGYSPQDEKESEIFIPDKFPTVLEDYNKNQLKSGFNLHKFEGKYLKRYTYNCADNVIITLFFYNNILAGREVKNN